MPSSSMLPLPLDRTQSNELRKLLRTAVTDAIQTFTARHVVKDGAGTPISGPDPRAIRRDAGFHLVRIMADHEIFDGQYSDDAFDPRAYDQRFRELEAELTARPKAPASKPAPRLTRRRPAGRRGP